MPEGGPPSGASAAAEAEPVQSRQMCTDDAGGAPNTPCFLAGLSRGGAVDPLAVLTSCASRGSHEQHGSWLTCQCSHLPAVVAPHQTTCAVLQDMAEGEQWACPLCQRAAHLRERKEQRRVEAEAAAEIERQVKEAQAARKAKLVSSPLQAREQPLTSSAQAPHFAAPHAHSGWPGRPTSA